jgi:hypothetical protein
MPLRVGSSAPCSPTLRKLSVMIRTIADCSYSSDMVRACNVTLALPALRRSQEATLECQCVNHITLNKVVPSCFRHPIVMD